MLDGVERTDESFGDRFDDRVEALSEVAPDVQHDALGPDERRGAEVLDEAGNGFLEQLGVGGGEIDEVGRVGVGVADVRMLLDRGGVGGGHRVGNGIGLPLPWALGEDLDDVGLHCRAARQPGGEPSRSRNLGTDEHASNVATE